MFSRDEAGPRDGLAPLSLLAAVVVIAVLVGSATAMAGTVAGHRAIYYVAVLAALLIGATITLTRAEPLRFAFLSLVAVMTFVSVPIPPGRFGLTVFDAGMLMLATLVLLQKAFAMPGTSEPLFPAPSFALVWLLLLPCALFARHPARAGLMVVLIFAGYMFFWTAVQELRRPGGMERLVGLLAVTLMITSAALYLDGVFHVNVSLAGTNPNQRMLIQGQWVWRAGGIFQDPQRAAAFLVSLMSFLLVLSVRQRFAGRLRALVWVAILGAVPALMLTVSRSAIVAFVLVSAAALVAVNRWSVVAKLATCAALLCGVVLTSANWSSLLPAPVAQRLANSSEEFKQRQDIWFDTWEMFADQPLTGIGPGGFQRYLQDTRPGQTDYYGVGASTGMSYVPDQPESGWFKILYETGILGSVATLLVIAATLRRAITGMIRSGDTAVRTEVVAALAGLTTFAITFTTLFTTADPRLLMLFALLLAVIWRVAPAPPPAAGRS